MKRGKLIKGLFRIRYLLNEKSKELVDEGAFLQIRYAKIYFEITRVKKKEVWVTVRQKENPNGNYFDENRLKEIVHELFQFEGFPEGVKFTITALPYKKEKVA